MWSNRYESAGWGGGWTSVGDVEIAVAEYVDWYNHRRPHGEIGLVPPAEFETNRWASLTPEHYPETPVPTGAGSQVTEPPRNPGDSATERLSLSHGRGRRPGPLRRQLLDVDAPLVSFRYVYTFPNGEQVTSDSTLRFRGDAENRDLLTAAGYALIEVREAPDRPGRERVYLASPTQTHSATISAA